MEKRKMEAFSAQVRSRVERYVKYIRSEYSVLTLSARIDAFGAVVDDTSLLMDPLKDKEATAIRNELVDWLYQEQRCLDTWREQYPDPKQAKETYQKFRKAFQTQNKEVILC